MKNNNRSAYYRERDEKIYCLYLDGWSREQLSERFGLDQESIRNIIKSETERRKENE